MGFAPLGAAPLGALLLTTAPAPVALPPPIATQSLEPGVWIAEIITTAPGAPAPAPVGILPLAAVPVAAPDRPGASPGPPQAILRVSDRGWIGEPGDSIAPNSLYPGRMVEPPALEAALPIYPDESRRLALRVGEIVLTNGDGRFDYLAGDWTLAGRAVYLLRGPHRRPIPAAYSEMVSAAALRAAGAATGTATLSIPLRPASADLDVPLCATYAGTGGAEGTATLAGQAKPRLFGRKRQLVPVLVDPGLLIYQIHDGTMGGISAVRDRGIDLAAAGNAASYAALAAATVAAGTYQTCNAAGVFRLGSTPSLVTCDAVGDNDNATGGYGTGSPGSVAKKLLATAGVGSFDPERWPWPVGEVGLYRAGGTVADALSALAAGIGGWWGVDARGFYGGGQIDAPEALAPALYIDPTMLAAPPEEIGTPRPPWWRARVGYREFGRALGPEDFAGAVTAATRQDLGIAYLTASASDAIVSTQYPLAEDGPVIVSVFDAAGDAQAIADRFLALYRRPRRLFQARMRYGAGGYAWPTLALGACVSLRWPNRTALAGGRPCIVVGVSSRGDAATLTLWG